VVFRKLLGSLGIDGPEVETTLASRVVEPGRELPITVGLRGGGADMEIERLRVDVVGRFEDMETTGTGWDNPGVLEILGERGPFTLAAGQETSLDLRFRVPLEMPLTLLPDGRRIGGARVAVRTELAVDKAVDRGDFDEFDVAPLPAQAIVLQAYRDLGFRLDEAELKWGTPASSVASAVNWWQEIELWFPPEYRRTDQIEMVFNAFADGMDLLTGGNDPRLCRLRLTYDEILENPGRIRELLDAHYRGRFLPRG
jgi:sporulation-control protein